IDSLAIVFHSTSANQVTQPGQSGLRGECSLGQPVGQARLREEQKAVAHLFNLNEFIPSTDGRCTVGGVLHLLRVDSPHNLLFAFGFCLNRFLASERTSSGANSRTRRDGDVLLDTSSEARI